VGANPITDGLSGWSSEIVVDVQWKGEVAGSPQKLSWTKFIPAAL
jgi:hypothetical protein